MELHPTPWTKVKGIDTVDKDYINSLLRLISIDLLTSRGLRSVNEAAQTIADKMNHDWRVTSPEGKLAKRLNNLLYKEWKVTLQPTHLDHLSRIVGQAVMPDCYARIVDKLRWTQGKYKDTGSCFWQSRKADRAALAANGTYALQLCADPNNTKETGLGRCFLLPHDGVVYLFNAYGYNMGAMLHVYRQLTGFTGNAPEVNLHLPIGGRRDSVYINEGALAIGGVSSRPADSHWADTHRVEMEACYCVHHYNDWAYPEQFPVCERCPWNRKPELPLLYDEGQTEDEQPELERTELYL